MKIANLLLGVVLAVGVFAFAGCKKKAGAEPSAAPMMVEGVQVDLPKLIQSITASGSAEAQTGVRNVQMSFRYRQYEKAMMDLDKLVTEGGLNEDQKKLAGEVIEQVKQVITKGGAPPAQ